MEEKRAYGSGGVAKLRYRDKKTGNMVESRYYYIFYRVGNRQVRESSKKTDSREAEALLQQRLGEYGLGITPQQDVNGVKYEEIRNAWHADLENKPHVGTLAHLDKFFGGMRVVSISSDTLRRFIETRRKQGAADATIRRNLVMLRAMMNQARKEKRLRMADIPYFPMPKDSQPRRGFIQPADFGKLLAAMPKNLRPLISFLYFTGCRLGAAKQITWDMVSSDCSEINLPGEITKTGEAITLPLAGAGLDTVAAALKKQFRVAGQPVFDTVNLRGAWVKTCGALGLGVFDKKTRTYHGLTIHDFRRSAVRNLIRAGVPRGTAMAISGHKTEHVFERYNVQSTDDLRDALIRVGQYAKISKRA